MDRPAIEKKLQALMKKEGLFHDQITLHHGAALVFHGLKNETSDIDMEVAVDAFVRLREKYTEGKVMLKFYEDLPFSHPGQFKPYLALDCFEIFPEELGAVDIIDDFIVYTPEAILKAKLMLNRKKDQAMIQQLQEHLAIEAAI